MVIKYGMTNYFDLEERKLLAVIQLVQKHLLKSVTHPTVVDIAFLGNTGGFYPWEPASLLDIDVCMFVLQRDSRLGHWLLKTKQTLECELASLRVDFDLRIIRGPYKPIASPILRPKAFAHLAVFTEEEYRSATSLVRWSWRKYRCHKEPEKLARLASARPTISDLQKAVDRKLQRICNGLVKMQEWNLPEFHSELLQFSFDEPEFTEYCLSGAATIARSHGRVLGKTEADTLPNTQYFNWYQSYLFPSSSLEQLMQMKDKSRRYGYATIQAASREHSIKYLAQLKEHLQLMVQYDSDSASI
jgi:uncharacterized protein (DUF3820 family)